MIKTTIGIPNPFLQSYIRAFELREVDTGDLEILKPLHANHETYISLFINCNNPGFISHNYEEPAYDSKEYSQPLAGIMGIQTYMRGSFVFRGRYKMVNIHFQPAGFHQLFGINARILTNRLMNVDSCVGHNISLLHEQIQHAIDDGIIFRLCEDWLLKVLRRALVQNLQEWPFPVMVAGTTDNYSVEQLATMANMTVKSFERKFKIFVGVGPKLYAQICRFNRVLDFKRNFPAVTWSFISSKYKFYDQMHFIKEFKRFAGHTPTRFFENTPPPAEMFLYPEL